MFLTDKPWLTTGVIGVQRSNAELLQAQAWSGLKLLFCVLTMLFFILVVAYYGRMDIADWQPLNEPLLLWINTGILVLSSIAMAKAQQAIQQENIVHIKTAFFWAGILTMAFLAGQLLVWQHYNDQGYYLASNPANTFFYMVTAIHGVHLFVGLGVWASANLKFIRGISATQLYLSINLCATYWHFLLFIWFVLFGLLLST